jgi:hypothetical protein
VIKRVLDVVAPRRAVSAEKGYRRLLRWAALPVTNRRWAAPLAAVALGFGLFAGVAIGPGAAGTLATAPYQLIEMPNLVGDAESGEGEEEAAASTAPESEVSEGFEEEESAAFTPVVPVAEESFESVAEEEPAPPPQAASDGEEEPSQPEAEELVGTVVHVNKAAGSYTVAEAGGVMSAVHAGKLPAAGAKVEVPIQALANGTLGEAGKRKKTGSKERATLAGIVTFVVSDPAAPAYTLSNRGTSALIHVHPDPTGALPALPALGAYTSVVTDLEAPGLLWQSSASGGGAPYTHADFEGIVAAFDPETRQLVVSADDRRESGQDLTFSVPAGIDASKVAVGESVLLAADIGADGSLTLTGLASDERLKGADDAKATQGDLVPEKPKGDE